MQSWSGKAIVRETPRQPVTLQLVKKSRPQNSEAKRKTTSGPYTRDVHRFPPGRGERVLAGAAVVVRCAPLGIDHALATESVQRLVHGGGFAAPRSRPPEDQIGRPAQDAALELLVVAVILAMMLILSLR